MSVSINLPGGAIERVSVEDLLWFRPAFSSEWKGAVMVRTAAERLYSSESVASLKAKFASDSAKLAEFTPPDAKMVMVVNAAKVRQVDAADPGINPESARAVLVFDSTTALCGEGRPQTSTDPDRCGGARHRVDDRRIYRRPPPDPTNLDSRRPGEVGGMKNRPSDLRPLDPRDRPRRQILPWRRRRRGSEARSP